MKSTAEPTMLRQPVQLPITQEEWFSLPDDFVAFMNEVDKTREQMDKEIPFDPLYPSYEYVWDTDDSIAIETLIYYWNKVDQPLPDARKIVEEISEGICEAGYEQYVAESYGFC